MDIIVELAKKFKPLHVVASLTIVLAFVYVPQIDFLRSSILPFDNVEQWGMLLFCVCVVLLTLEFIIFIFKQLSKLHLKAIEKKEKAKEQKKLYQDIIDTLSVLPVEEQKILRGFLNTNNKPCEFEKYNYPDRNEALNHLKVQNIICELPGSETVQQLKKNIFGEVAEYPVKKAYFKIHEDVYSKIKKFYENEPALKKSSQQEEK